MNSRTYILSVAVSVVLVGLSGCSQQEADRIEKVSKKAWNKATDLTTQAGGQLGLNLRKSNNPLQDLDVVNRVQSRIKSDRRLRGSAIRVELDGPQLTLSGTVVSDDQRKRALEVAREAAGVEKVRETLQIVGPK